MANGNVGRAGGDVFAVLGWGLRRYAWLVALFVLSLGIIVPAFLDRVPDEYEAQAQVGPIEELNLQNLDPIPRLAESVFNNGGVAESVRESYDPPLPRSTRVIPGRVRLVTAQDNVVLTLVGRGPTPESASEHANVAAAALTDELNKYSAPVGSFAVQRQATPPTEPVSKTSDALSIGLGVLAGLTAAVGAVGLLLAWRRPVLDAGSAEEITGAPVLGRVWLGRSSDESRGLPQMCRRVLASGTNELLLTGSPGTSQERQLLASALTRVLAGKRDVVVSDANSEQRGPHATPGAFDGPEPLLIIDAPSPARIATRSETSLTLLVVREGTARSSLLRQVEQYLDDGAVGVVLVRKPGRLKSAWRRRSPKAATLRTGLTRIARGNASNRLSYDPDADTQPVGGPQSLQSATHPRIKGPRP